MFNPSIRPLLAIDAATCALMGVFLAAASGPIADATNIPAVLLLAAGLALFPIALFMGAMGALKAPPAWATALVVAGNMGWVLASIALPAFGLISPNALGWTFLLLQAGLVALVALLEARALPSRRLLA